MGSTMSVLENLRENGGKVVAKREELPFITENLEAISGGTWAYGRETAIKMYCEGHTYEAIASMCGQPIRAVKATMALLTSKDESLYRARYLAVRGMTE